MKKIPGFIIALLFASSVSFSQTVTDFTKKSCSTGKIYNMFSELDSNKAIILEFFHSCAPCSQAAATIKPLYQNLVTKYGNKVNFFVMPEDDDSFNCSQVLGWTNTSGVSSLVVPFDSGGVQTAYYGGGGMPTVVVVAGKAHKILFCVNANTASFATSDTGKIDYAIRNFLDSAFAGVPDISSSVSANIFPNPVSNDFRISIETQESGTLKLELADITGQRIIELTEEKIQSGIWTKNFSIPLANGNYLIKGLINEKPFQKKIMVIR